MLERTSRFVLEVMPYLLSALIAALLAPSLLFSQAEGAKAVAVPYAHQAAPVADGVLPDSPAGAEQGTLQYR